MFNAVRAKRPLRLPVVLSKPDVQRLLSVMEGTFLLMAQLLYGAGLQLMECVRLRGQGCCIRGEPNRSPGWKRV